MSERKKFTFYWNNGQREVVESNSITEALSRASHAGETPGRLCFYTPDENNDFTFDPETSTWKLFSHVWQDSGSN